MFTCPECASPGKRRPRTFKERFTNRAKLVCVGCGGTWFWRRVPFQKYAHCPQCGTPRLSKLSKYDRIDRKSSSWFRKLLGLFGAPIYHCTFCRLQFRDFHNLDPNRPSKIRTSGASNGRK